MTDTIWTDTVRLTVSEAAEQLGISAEAIRQRISRNTIRHTKIGTTVYVELEQDQTNQTKHDTDKKRQDANLTALLESQQDQITYLRDQLDTANEANREMRRLVAALTQRIPELPAPDHQTNEDAVQATSKADVRADHQPAQQGFWRRLFGG